MTEVPQWTVLELEFEGRESPEYPLADVTCTVRFTGPSGQEQKAAAFWDGEHTWRARFCPDERGEWSWRTHCEHGEDPGLEGEEGTFQCTRYEGSNELYLRGPVDLSPDRRRFVHADATPFFWLSDTAWNGAIKSMPGDWGLYLRNRAEQGFTAVQMVTTQWRGCSENPQGEVAYRQIDGEMTVNPSWFQRLDEKVAAVNEHGLLAALVVLWAYSESDPGRALSVENATNLARYIVSRWHAYNVVWLLGGDGRYEDPERWRQIAEGSLWAGQRRPAALHIAGQHWPLDDLRGEGWLDVIGYQSGHGSADEDLEWLTSGPPSCQWQKEPPRPIINMEPNYEGHPSYHEDLVFTDYHVRRACYWSLLIAPTAGVSYGHNYIWPWQPRSEVPEGHEYLGWVAPWREGIQTPGTQSIQRLEAFFDALQWWTLEPAQHLVAEQPGSQDPTLFVAAAMAGDGSLAVLYLPRGGEVQLNTDALQTPAPAVWVDPRHGARRDAGQVTDQDSPHTFRAPDTRDWLLQVGNG